jgi:hypothetical protein
VTRSSAAAPWPLVRAAESASPPRSSLRFKVAHLDY